jgi:hypothetical protein
MYAQLTGSLVAVRESFSSYLHILPYNHAIGAGVLPVPVILSVVALVCHNATEFSNDALPTSVQRIKEVNEWHNFFKLILEVNPRKKMNTIWVIGKIHTWFPMAGTLLIKSSPAHEGTFMALLH